MSATAPVRAAAPEAVDHRLYVRGAVWFGLATGLVEVAILAARKFGLGEFLFLSQDVLWLAPTLNAACLLIPGWLLYLAARTGWRVATPGLGLGLFTFFAAFDLLLMYERMHGAAALLLAAGIGVQGGRWLASRRPALERVIRRSLPALLTLVALMGIGLRGSRMVHERLALGRLVPPAGNAPNVLLIVLDTVRGWNLSLYGYRRETTPELTRFARQGVRFDRAFAAAPWTLPSHASIFTGRWPHELSADYNAALDGRYPRLANVLAARGYATGGFAANKKYCGWETGLQRGFAHYEDYLLTPGELARSTALGRAITGHEGLRRLLDWQQFPGRQSAPEINDAFLGWLDHQNGRPFFAFLNYFDAHTPYLPPAPYDTMYGPKRPRFNPAMWPQETPWAADQIQAELDAYDGAITYLDAQLGVLFRAMESRGVLENTIVVVTADHGEEFGEHGFMMHGHSLYRALVQVPLLVVFPPRVPAGVQSDLPVSLRDIPATIMDLLGTGDRPFPGRSLARAWSPDPADARGRGDTLVAELTYARNLPARYAVSKGDMVSLALDRWRYIKNGDGREELYDFDRDPGEQSDLAGTPEGLAELPRLRSALSHVVGDWPVRREGTH